MLVAWCNDYPGSPATACRYIVEPVDGGPWRFFVVIKGVPQMPDIGQPFPATDGDAPRWVHFLNRTDGFVYGHAAAFVTHDGAQTWTDSGLPTFEVVSITGRGNVAWAVTRDCIKGTTCPFSVRLTTDAGNTWSQPHSLPDGFSPVGATAYGSGGLVIWSPSDLVLTSDGGTTWSQIKGKCTGDLTIRDFAATPDGGQLWEVCTTLTADGESKQLFLSQDGGASWSIRAQQRRSHGTFLTLASPRVGTLIVATDTDALDISHDSGLNWAEAPGPRAAHLNGIMTIRFATAMDGWARDYYGGFWATHDGGDNWTEVLIPSCPTAHQCTFQI